MRSARRRGPVARRRLGRTRVRAGPDTGDGDAVADLVDLVAVGMRAGLEGADATLVALATIQPSPGLSPRWTRLERDARCRRLDARSWGGSAGTTGPASSVEDLGRSDLDRVAAAWQLSADLGVPLAPVLEQVAATIRKRRQAAEHLQALAAGPRTSMWVLTALPLAGPVLAVVVGVSPARLLTQSPVAAGSAVVGLVLTGLGWWWSRVLTSRATRPRRLR